MRIDGTTLSAGAGIAIVFGLLGAGIAKFWACPADGNPVGYHLVGKALLTNSGFDATKCGTECTLTFDIRTDQHGAVSNVSSCGSQNCLHFKDDGQKVHRWTLLMSDAGGQHPPYTDYVDGTVTIGP